MRPIFLPVACIWAVSAQDLHVTDSGETDNIPDVELIALHALYNVTLGEDWKWGKEPGTPWNFSANANPCVDMWEGVRCTDLGNDGYLHIEALLLTDYNLNGFIPNSIDELTMLRNLSLGSNSFSWGGIPSSITTLNYLEYLDLSASYVFGPIPENIGDMSNLTYLNIGNCMLWDTIPESICNLQQLQYLGLGANALSGTLHECYGQLSNLQDLYLDNIYLTGTIPSSLGNLTNLRRLHVEINSLVGTIPGSLQALTQLRELYINTNYLTGQLPEYMAAFPQLTAVNMWRNQFTGTLPASFGDLPNLSNLVFDNNMITGTIPETLCQLHNLQILQANDNELTGTIPACLGTALPQLQFLALYVNLLSGPIPAMQVSPVLKLLILEENYLTGTIPDVARQPLEYAVGKNLLTGTLPASLFSSPYMIGMELKGNQLTGPIPLPTSLTPDPQMYYISLSGNYLSGTLSGSLGSYSNLVFLDVSVNSLTGSIPQAVTNCTLLNFMYMGVNHFTGGVPSDLDSLPGVGFMFMNSNLLSCSLPSSIGGMAALQILNMSSNCLTGTLPPSLARLESAVVLLFMDNQFTGPIDGIFNASQVHLSTLQLSDNQLTGTLPGGLGQLRSLNVFAAVGNCFQGSIPEGLCASGSLNTLALDGLQSSPACQQRLFPAALEGTVVARSLYSIRNPLTGGVPSCLFNMINLTTLHLSGNGLTGSIPEGVVVSPALTDVSLSHNKLSRHIPGAVLARNWANLDLSYNQLGGKLLTAVGSNYSTDTAIYLDNNRLSGPFPKALKPLRSLSVLERNVFSCDASRSDLPPSDPNTGKYECGSVTFDTTIYAWLALCTLLAVAAVAAPRWKVIDVFLGQLRAWWLAADKLGIEVGCKVGELRAVQAMVDVIVKVACLVGTFILLLLTPLYGGCSDVYATYAYEYAWGLSAAYLSGTVPFALMFVAFAATVGLMVVAAYVLGRRYLPRGAPQLEPQQLGSQARTIAVRCAVVLVNFIVVLGVNTGYVTISLNQNGTALTMAQIALALFKVVFNGACSPVLMRWACQRLLGRQPSATSFIALQLFINMVNNIFVPCLVVAIISPSCFYNVFKQASDVQSEFQYAGRCTEFEIDSVSQTSCFAYATEVAHTSYTPPFTYSYQCSSSFITYYAPAFVIMCIIAGFAVPLAQVLLLCLHQRAPSGTGWFALLDLALPRLLKPTPADEACGVVGTVQRNVYSPFFDASHHVITLLTYLALLLTFGTVFPPLAVCFAVTILCMAVFTRLKVGRFLTLVSTVPYEEGGPKSVAGQRRPQGYLEVLGQECEGVGRHKVLGRAVGMIAVASCFFFTLFLFDTLGDAVGLSRAYWVLIVVPGAPLTAAAVVGVALRRTAANAGTPRGGTGDSGSNSNRETEGEHGAIELQPQSVVLSPLADENSAV